MHVDLVPVFLGSGIPLLGMIKDAPVELDGPISGDKGIHPERGRGNAR